MSTIRLQIHVSSVRRLVQTVVKGPKIVTHAKTSFALSASSGPYVIPASLMQAVTHASATLGSTGTEHNAENVIPDVQCAKMAPT